MTMHRSNEKSNPTRRNKITRRSVLAAAPALACGHAAASAPACDPIPAWYREWKRKNQKWIDAIDGPEEDTAFHEVCELERLICTTRPTTREGAIAQLEYALEDFGDYITGNIWHGLDAKLFGNLLAALKSGVAA